MQSVKLELHGHTFAECFEMPLHKPFRVAQAMTHDACLMYVQQGMQKVYSTGQTLEVKKNESSLLKCGNHIADLIGDDGIYRGVVFHFHPDSVQKVFESKSSDFFKASRESSHNNKCSGLVNRSKFMDDYVQSLSMYFNNPSLINEALLEVKLQELVLLLADTGNEVIDHLLSSLYKAADTEFSAVIEANLYNNLSIKELAFLTNRSESTFKRDFKKWYDQSPAKYFRQKKLERAKKLLPILDLAISGIAYDCGFETPAHFTKCFHDEYGFSPSAFRKEFKTLN